MLNNSQLTKTTTNWNKIYFVSINLSHKLAHHNIRFSCQFEDNREEHLFRERFGN